MPFTYFLVEQRQFALRFQGPKLFYSFATEIQNADSFSQFKSKLKSILLNWLPIILFYFLCVFLLFNLNLLINSIRHLQLFVIS